MKLYLLIVGTALLMVIVSPEMMLLPSAQAAPSPSWPDLTESPSCETSSCRAGWQLAIEKAIDDEGECPLISGAQEEIEGCRKFVHAGSKID